MLFDFTIPESNDSPLTFSLDIGQCIFVLGANKTGKSSLMQKIRRTHHGKAQRISAHRQIWFASSSVTLSPEQNRNTETNISNCDTGAEPRWKKDYAAQRANIAIYDLMMLKTFRHTQAQVQLIAVTLTVV